MGQEEETPKQSSHQCSLWKQRSGEQSNKRTHQDEAHQILIQAAAAPMHSFPLPGSTPTPHSRQEEQNSPAEIQRHLHRHLQDSVPLIWAMRAEKLLPSRPFTSAKCDEWTTTGEPSYHPQTFRGPSSSWLNKSDFLKEKTRKKKTQSLCQGGVLTTQLNEFLFGLPAKRMYSWKQFRWSKFAAIAANVHPKWDSNPHLPLRSVPRTITTQKNSSGSWTHTSLEQSG